MHPRRHTRSDNIMFLLEVGNLKENFAKYFAVEAAVDEAMKR